MQIQNIYSNVKYCHYADCAIYPKSGLKGVYGK